MRSIAVKFERRVSSMAEWAKRIACFALVLFVTAGLGHRYGLVETVAFLWTLALVAALALLGLVLATGGFVRLWRYGDKAGRASLIAVFIALLVLAPYGVSVWFYWRLPALNDVTTDLDQPPQFNVAPQFRNGQMNAITPITPKEAALQVEAYPEAVGRRIDASPDRVLAALAPVIEALEWKVRGNVPASAYASEISIEMQAPSFVLRIPADAVVRLTSEDEITFVDMRIAARYGQHDLGEGVRRINSFMAALAAELERQSLQIIDIPPSDGDVDRVD